MAKIILGMDFDDLDEIINLCGPITYHAYVAALPRADQSIRWDIGSLIAHFTDISSKHRIYNDATAMYLAKRYEDLCFLNDMEYPLDTPLCNVPLTEVHIFRDDLPGTFKNPITPYEADIQVGDIKYDDHLYNVMVTIPTNMMLHYLPTEILRNHHGREQIAVKIRAFVSGICDDETHEVVYRYSKFDEHAHEVDFELILTPNQKGWLESLPSQFEKFFN